MAQDTATSGVSLTLPSLPKGGGAIQGMGETLGNIGASGMLTLTLPLPVSSGRGYAPSVSVGYSSGAGNGVFGLGWDVGLLKISRRTSTGVPSYDETDMFLGPGGDVLIPECDPDTGKPITTSASSYGTKTLGEAYTVTRFMPRVEGSFSRIELWQPQKGHAPFWLVHESNGQLHCLGKTTSSRIADPSLPETHIAVWLIEESLSPTGEHIYYQYQSAKETGLPDGQRDTQSNRYLSAVSYANANASRDLFLWNGDTAAAQENWYCTLVFDYGQRGLDPDTVPECEAPQNQAWPVRQDPFSHYGYGFEVRTHFLCHQVLMFHHFPLELGSPSTLISRLLLEYDESPVVSHLVSAQHFAYEPNDNALQSMPPLELEYSQFTSPPSPPGVPAWKPFAVAPGVDLPPYQMVDLFGEGLPGILYQVGNLWRYHEPVRDESDPDPDAVTYKDWETLPLAPALFGGNAALLDIDGDGRLEWMITRAGGPVGFYRMNADRSWSHFTPFQLLPAEFMHPQSTHADLHGSGLPDLAMIGPKSVRLYINERVGYGRAKDVNQLATVRLPVAGRDATELVALSDVLGSGQSHLVSVRYNRLECWPNLGNGRFGTPLSFPLPFSETTFNPRRIYLVDVDGSGAADILYADSNHICLLHNLSGNGFADPVKFSLPEGVHFTDLSQINFADLSGQGTLSLILSQPYTGPALSSQFWRYDFASEKPYLLKTIDNNLGAQKHITYRSSAQEWLDEKQDAESKGKTAIPGLPFPVHLVITTTSDDALTGNSLTSSYRFRNGFYDGLEREFRGFGYVEAKNCARDQQADAGQDGFSAPLVTKTWYHTGRENDETNLFGTPYHDQEAFETKPTRLTKFDPQKNTDQLIQPEAEQTWWLYRALNGHLLREEIYGDDQQPSSALPYSVSVSRYQVRLLQAQPKDTLPEATRYAPVVLPVSIEQTSYNYQRVATDPLIGQSIQLQYDKYAALIWGVSVQYPRRVQETNPYSDTALPSACWPETLDLQQNILRLQEGINQPVHQPSSQAWLLSIPYQTRQNGLDYDSAVPNGLHVEDLIDTANPACLLSPQQTRTFLGQTVIHYKTGDMPGTLKLVDYVETAALDLTSLDAYTSLPAATRQALLTAGGYEAGTYVLERPGVTTSGELWIARHSFTDYLGENAFWRPSRQWNSALSPQGTTVLYDPYTVCVISAEQAYQNKVTVNNDYRFLTPWHITDVNNNEQEVQYNALGQVVATSFYGSELAQPMTDTITTKPVGFKSVRDYPVSATLTVSNAINAAISAKTPQKLAAISVYDAFSWMGSIDKEAIGDACGDGSVQAIWNRLLELRFITHTGALRRSARSWLHQQHPIEGLPQSLYGVLLDVVHWPAHALSLIADAYPEDTQQIQISLGYTDGFGRNLQSIMRVPAGEAFDRLASGELNTDPQGNFTEITADPRWGVSGRVEYNNAGQIIRVYQPYFVNDWQYVADQSMRTNGYADTHYYDALGREFRVRTAKGYLRRKTYGSWFVITEDENDTWSEVEAGV